MAGFLLLQTCVSATAVAFMDMPIFTEFSPTSPCDSQKPERCRLRHADQFLAGEYFKALRLLLATSARPVILISYPYAKASLTMRYRKQCLATYRKTGVYLHAPTVHSLRPPRTTESA